MHWRSAADRPRTVGAFMCERTLYGATVGVCLFLPAAWYVIGPALAALLPTPHTPLARTHAPTHAHASVDAHRHSARGFWRREAVGAQRMGTGRCMSVAWAAWRLGGCCSLLLVSAPRCRGPLMPARCRAAALQLVCGRMAVSCLGAIADGDGLDQCRRRGDRGGGALPRDAPKALWSPCGRAGR